MSCASPTLSFAVSSRFGCVRSKRPLSEHFYLCPVCAPNMSLSRCNKVWFIVGSLYPKIRLVLSTTPFFFRIRPVTLKQTCANQSHILRESSLRVRTQSPSGQSLAALGSCRQSANVGSSEATSATLGVGFSSTLLRSRQSFGVSLAHITTTTYEVHTVVDPTFCTPWVSWS